MDNLIHTHANVVSAYVRVYIHVLLAGVHIEYGILRNNIQAGCTCRFPNNKHIHVYVQFEI